MHARVTATFAAGSPAHTCLARLENAPDGRLDWRFRPIHRDIYHDQVLVTRRGLGLLDFDDAAMSEPAVDVANFLAHLRLLALEEPSRAAALAAPSAALSAATRSWTQGSTRSSFDSWKARPSFVWPASTRSFPRSSSRRA